VHGPVSEALRNEDVVEVRADDMAALQAALGGMAGIQSIKMTDGTLVLSCNSGTVTTHINEYCMQHGIVLSHLMQKKKSLETKFMELTNN
jgi:ABC-2 type transport system ATP-binding protein